MNILQEIGTAAAVFGKVRKARKAGADAVQIKPVYTVPYRKPQGGHWFAGTPEAHILSWYPGIYNAVRDVFQTLDNDTQYSYLFGPKDGGWADRMRFWQELLRPTLEPKQYHEVMGILLPWAIRCLKWRKEAAEARI